MAQEDKTPRQVGLKRDGTPQKRANQWTKAKEVQGKVNERDRDRIRAEVLAHRLEQHVEGKVELSATQVQAAKILIDKGKPSLQAVEQTIHEEPKSEAEIVAQLHALLANPGVRAQIEAMLKGAPILVDGVGEAQQTPDPAHMSIANASK
jgi:polynucleotide 5'-kinase involved in rRNA processing